MNKKGSFTVSSLAYRERVRPVDSDIRHIHGPRPRRQNCDTGQHHLRHKQMFTYTSSAVCFASQAGFDPNLRGKTYSWLVLCADGAINLRQSQP